MVFNIDETGFSPNAMSKNYSAIIPDEFSNNPCYLKVPKNERNITVVVCISLDCDLLPPELILPRTTIPNDIESVGIRVERMQYSCVQIQDISIQIYL